MRKLIVCLVATASLALVAAGSSVSTLAQAKPAAPYVDCGNCEGGGGPTDPCDAAHWDYYAVAYGRLYKCQYDYNVGYYWALVG